MLMPKDPDMLMHCYDDESAKCSEGKIGRETAGKYGERYCEGSLCTRSNTAKALIALLLIVGDVLVCLSSCTVGLHCS